MTQPAPARNLPLGLLRRSTRRFLDLLMPPQCLGCGGLVAGDGALCPDCWDGMAFLVPPVCERCGTPFLFDPGGAAVCGACARRPPPWDRARAAFVYDGASRGLVLALKHADRTDTAPVLGRWLLQAGADLTADADLVAPVPLHWSRLFARRYNQAALLAGVVAREAGLAHVPDLLVRGRRTASQGHLSPARRRANVRGAFQVRPGLRDRVEGRRVVLVDDVLTTGATLAACARSLKRAGAAGVDALTLARVVKGRAEEFL